MIKKNLSSETNEEITKPIKNHPCCRHYIFGDKCIQTSRRLTPLKIIFEKQTNNRITKLIMFCKIYL